MLYAYIHGAISKAVHFCRGSDTAFPPPILHMVEILIHILHIYNRWPIFLCLIVNANAVQLMVGYHTNEEELF